MSAPLPIAGQSVYINVSIDDAAKDSLSFYPLSYDSPAVDLFGQTATLSAARSARTGHLSATYAVLREGGKANTLLWAPVWEP